MDGGRKVDGNGMTSRQSFVEEDAGGRKKAPGCGETSDGRDRAIIFIGRSATEPGGKT